MAEETAPPQGTPGEGQPPKGAETTPPTPTDPAAAAGEAERWKQASRKNENDLKAALKKLAALEDAGKSELEKTLARAEVAERRVQENASRVAKAELKALAAGVLAHAEDAARFLDVAAYVNGDGEFDSTAAAKDLKALLAERPDLGVQPGSRAPAHQPGQGSSGAVDPTGKPRDVFESWFKSQLAT